MVNVAENFVTYWVVSLAWFGIVRLGSILSQRARGSNRSDYLMDCQRRFTLLYCLDVFLSIFKQCGLVSTLSLFL